MARGEQTCPHCGRAVRVYRNPLPTVDIIISHSAPGRERGVVLIRRNRAPFGWALPGGFIEYGESAEDAARREAWEETGLEVGGLVQFGVYSDPDRDPRHHTLTVVFSARAEGPLRAGDDAGQARVFAWDELPSDLCFDHGKILADFLARNRPDQGSGGL